MLQLVSTHFIKYILTNFKLNSDGTVIKDLWDAEVEKTFTVKKEKTYFEWRSLLFLTDCSWCSWCTLTHGHTYTYTVYTVQNSSNKQECYQLFSFISICVSYLLKVCDVSVLPLKTYANLWVCKQTFLHTYTPTVKLKQRNDWSRSCRRRILEQEVCNYHG